MVMSEINCWIVGTTHFWHGARMDQRILKNWDLYWFFERDSRLTYAEAEILHV
jgi:purine nucleoside permease